MADSEKKKRLNSYLFLKDGQSEKHRGVWERRRYKEPCQTDIAAVEGKAGSNVQSLPVILLERRNGRGDGGEERRRGWLPCHRKHMLLAVPSSRRGDASPSTALQTVWHRGHRRKPLERSEPPASSVERVCVRTLRVRRRVLCVCPYVAAYAFQM